LRGAGISGGVSRLVGKLRPPQRGQRGGVVVDAEEAYVVSDGLRGAVGDIGPQGPG
jgi:hypothetical protein